MARRLDTSASSPRSISFWIVVAVLAVVDALSIAAVPILFAADQKALAFFLIGAAFAMNVVYLVPATRASRWILPGFIFMALFVIWPVLFTAYVSLTNWATGNILTKAQVIEQLEEIPVAGGDDGGSGFLNVYDDGTGDLRFLITDPESGDVYFGIPRDKDGEVADAATAGLEGLDVVDADADGTPESIDGFELVPTLGLFSIAEQLGELVLDLPNGIATVQTVSQVSIVQSTQRYVYDEARDVLIDTQLNVECVEFEGNFVCDGKEVNPGWRVVIGADNFRDALTRPELLKPLIEIFTWNMVFALGSVGLTFALGLMLALAIQPEKMKGRAFYRSVFIIPYAIPPFISSVVWRGLLNTEFGQVNDLLGNLGASAIPWLQDPNWAKAAVLLVNLWLGFPYMFLIASGALQSIPQELTEAAVVDGASARQVFWRVTLPLLLVSTAPLLIGSFAFNFNNFVLIFILTQGGPPVIGAPVPYGSTDILISFVFDLAFSSGRGSNFGLASAYTILIFVLVALFSAIGFRASRSLEEVYGD
ncbi:MAG: ABC transporter permease subunit [Acidimicrobiia bacterium]|nr:MAG: ABC transporter permease subunit [Acidimicrobiia bacterium]